MYPVLLWGIIPILWKCLYVHASCIQTFSRWHSTIFDSRSVSNHDLIISSAITRGHPGQILRWKIQLVICPGCPSKNITYGIYLSRIVAIGFLFWRASYLGDNLTPLRAPSKEPFVTTCRHIPGACVTRVFQSCYKKGYEAMDKKTNMIGVVIWSLVTLYIYIHICKDVW